MKSRLRKKYWGCKCAHDKSYDDMVTDDPYPMYLRWFVCAKQPHYTNRPTYDIENEINKYAYDICENCPCYAISRDAMREYHNERKLEKKYWKSHKDEDLPFNKMDPSEELPF